MKSDSLEFIRSSAYQELLQAKKSVSFFVNFYDLVLSYSYLGSYLCQDHSIGQMVSGYIGTTSPNPSHLSGSFKLYVFLPVDLYFLYCVSVLADVHALQSF